MPLRTSSPGRRPTGRLSPVTICSSTSPLPRDDDAIDAKSLAGENAQAFADCHAFARLIDDALVRE